MDDGGLRLRILFGVAGAVLVLYLVVQQIALRDLRRLEHDYIAAREPTACATQSLLPFAFADDFDERDLDEALLLLIRDARDESARLRDDFRERDVFPFPPTRGAHDALADALAKQVALYDAMLDSPEQSDDELRALGFANTAFERRMSRARNLLFVGLGEGWNRRFICDKDAPKVPAP